MPSLITYILPLTCALSVVALIFCAARSESRAKRKRMENLRREVAKYIQKSGLSR